MRNVLATMLLAMFLTGNAFGATEKTNDPGRPQRSTTGAVFRSLFVPGWGQWYCERKIRAAVFFVAETSFISSISWNHDQMKRFQTGGDDVLKKFYENQRNRMIWWLAGTTLLSMGDAYVDAHLYGLDISPELGTDGTTGMRVSLKF